MKNNGKYILVIGAGNYGLALSAYLSMNNINVNLWNRSISTINSIQSNNSIYLSGIINYKARIKLITDNIDVALKNVNIIIITTPASSHKDIIYLLKNKIRKDHIIIISPGRTLGALEFYLSFKRNDMSNVPYIAETQTILFTCRKISENNVSILAVKENVKIASVIKNNLNYVINQLPDCIKKLLISANCLTETSLGNIGMILHPAPVLLNIGWIESKEHCFKYYYEGITESISNVLEKIDIERINVSEKLNCKMDSLEDWLKKIYKANGNNIYECIKSIESYKYIDAPNSINHRYIFEDIPSGLVPLESIANSFGIKVKTTSLIIELANNIFEYDFRKNGRTLDYLNISQKELIQYLE